MKGTYSTINSGIMCKKCFDPIHSWLLEQPQYSHANITYTQHLAPVLKHDCSSLGHKCPFLGRNGAFVPFTIQSNINSYLVFVPNAGSVVVPRGALGRSYGGLEDPLPCPNTRCASPERPGAYHYYFIFLVLFIYRCPARVNLVSGLAPCLIIAYRRICNEGLNHKKNVVTNFVSRHLLPLGHSLYYKNLR